MRITFHGKFAEDYGKDHKIEANSIYEAVSALTTQLGFYADRMLHDRPLARIVGYNTDESLLENSDHIHIIPAVFGGKGVGKVLIGAALIGAVLVTGGAAGFFGATLAPAILGMGVGLVFQGLSELFMKAPSLSKETDPDASKYLGLANNTTKLGTIRSFSLGRVKMTAPHILAVNVDSNDLVRGEFPA